tara:strand:+ start:161 stop:451 length:291 start_codon:yes stop_codon:yes gene_type:complete
MSVGKTWQAKDFTEQASKFQNQFEKRLILGLFDKTKQRSENSQNNLKRAWILVGKTKFMAWVDNTTMKAFKADGYLQTNIEWKQFTFIRWCTTFDL